MTLGSLRKGPATALQARVRARVEQLEGRALLSAGDLDTWGGGDGLVVTDVNAADSPNAMAIQADGRIVTLGSVTSADGLRQQVAVTRHFANGGIDTTFGGGDGVVITEFTSTNDSVGQSVAIDNQQRIVVAGTTGLGSTAPLTVARFLSNGNPDPSFGSGDGFAILPTTGDFASDIDVVITPGGLIRVGYTRSIGTEADMAIVGLNDGGFLDGGFGDGGVVFTNVADLDTSAGLAIDALGNITQAGVSTFSTESGGRLVTTRFLPNGARDESGYATDTNGVFISSLGVMDGGRSVMLDADGSLLVAGFSNGIHPTTGFSTSFLRLARVTSDGSDVTPAAPGLSSDSTLWSMAVQGDGKILIAGDDSHDTNDVHYVIARFTSQLVLDTPFGDGDGTADGIYRSPTVGTISAAVVADSQGQILVAGRQPEPGFTGSDYLLARHNSGVEPAAPIITADANARVGDTPYEVIEGATLELIGSGSIAGGAGGVTFVQNQRRVETVTGGGGTVVLDWDLDADGEFDDYTGADPEINAGALDGPDTVSVALRVSDASNPQNFEIDTATVTVNNVAPTATINLPPGTPLEGQSVTLTSTVTDGSAADTFTYAWTVASGATTLTGTGPSFAFTPADNGEYTVDLRVHDDDGGQDDAQQQTLVVQNAAPSAAIAGGAASIDEGTALSYTSTTDDVDADPLTFQWTVTKNSLPFASATTEDFTFTPDDNGAYLVSLTVNDGDGGIVTSNTLGTTVNNVTPTPDVADTVGVRGEEHTLLLAAADPSTADTAEGFSYTVNWGDSSPVETFAAGTTEARHTYQQNGEHIVQVTATDQDEATSAPVSISMTTQTAALANGVLTVSGNGGADKIRIFPAGAGGISVGVSDTGGGADEFVQTYNGPINRIVVNGRAGDDQIDATTVTIPVEMYGGLGHDKLQSGSGGDVISGGDGDDKIAGNAGRDVLIGGLGADKISGNSDDDILIGGFTAHDANVLALRGISAEWKSTRTYTQRAGNISGSAPMASRLNGTFYFTASGANVTTWDDGSVDTLAGEAGSDWFFANIDTGVKDKIVDASSSEFIFDVNPVV